MSDITPNPETRIALFQRKEVRRTIHNNEWWFVISDVITALTDSVDPSQYLKRIRQRDPQLNEAFKGGVQFVPPPLALSLTRQADASCHPRELSGADAVGEKSQTVGRGQETPQEGLTSCKHRPTGNSLQDRAVLSIVCVRHVTISGTGPCSARNPGLKQAVAGFEVYPARRGGGAGVLAPQSRAGSPKESLH